MVVDCAVDYAVDYAAGLLAYKEMIYFLGALVLEGDWGSRG